MPYVCDVWRGCCPFTMLWVPTLIFDCAVFVGAALTLLLDVDEALYLAVCGNTFNNTTYGRGTAALFLP